MGEEVEELVDLMAYAIGDCGHGAGRRERAEAAYAVVSDTIQRVERERDEADEALVGLNQEANFWATRSAEALSRAQATEAQVEAMRKALSYLVICARTSGGTAGADPQLMDACDQAEFALASSTPESRDHFADVGNMVATVKAEESSVSAPETYPVDTLLDALADAERDVESVGQQHIPTSKARAFCSGKANGFRAAWELVLRFRVPVVAESSASLQARVQPWMMACFGPEIASDRLERNDRFMEEAIELVQASGYSKERVYALADYVYGRPQGEINQEVGGVMITLAAHCLAHGVDMHQAGETELARIWTKVGQIRAKQAAKPKGSALPIAPAEARSGQAEGGR